MTNYEHPNPETNVAVGTLIRGSDGKIYFIPDRDLKLYEVVREATKTQIEQIYDGFTDDIQTDVDARRVSIVQLPGIYHNRNHGE